MQPFINIENLQALKTIYYAEELVSEWANWWDCRKAISITISGVVNLLVISKLPCLQSI